MAFNSTGWQNLTAFGKNAPNLISYESSVDDLATVSASGYFNEYLNQLEVGYVIFVEASDDNQLLRVTSVTTNVAVENYQVASIEDGAVTTPKLADLAVTTAKLAELAVTEAKLGALSVTEAKLGALAVTEAKIDALAVTAGKIGALAVTEAKIAALAVTTAKIDSSAVTTAKLDDLSVTTAKLVDGNVTQVKLAANSLDGTVIANLGDASLIGVPSLAITVETPGGATADTDVIMTHKVRVLDVFVVNKENGSTSDTLQVKNLATAITNVMNVSGVADNLIRAEKITVATAVINAAGTLRISQIDGAGSDSPPTIVTVTVVRVA